MDFNAEELAMIKHGLEKAIREYQEDIELTIADAELGDSNQQMAVEWYKDRIIKANELLTKIALKVPVWG